MTQLKLAEESEIVLEEKPHIVDTILQHGNSFDPHTKSETGDRFRIVLDMMEYFGVDHAGTEDFKPATVFADSASFPTANDTGDIYLGARLGEREKTGSQPDADVFAEVLVNKDRQYSFQIPEGDSLVDHEPFYLVEHGGMGCIGITTVHGTGGDDSHRWRVLQHGAYLDRRCMGS